MNDRLKFYGTSLVLYGLLALILSYTGLGLFLFDWPGMWGPALGFYIRLSLTVLGFILWIFGHFTEKK